MRVLVSAGEVSGDTHAAAVVRELLARHPDAEIAGIAGPGMRRAGCETLVAMDELNVMGVSEVVTALPRLRRARERVLAWSGERRPDVAVLVDYPGFHMRLGERLRRRGVPVLQYIAPKLWAWGEGRVRRLCRSQDLVASILPFEPEWFAARGVEARYVGNPSAYACRGGWSRGELCRRIGVDPGARLLALLPGSRPAELARHLPLLAETVRRLRARYSDLHFVVPRAPGLAPEALTPLVEAGAHLVARDAPDFALHADAAVAVSGTATLELALWGVPSVLVYRAAPLTMWLARRLVRVKCAGLANILLGDRPVMPELIDDACTAGRVEEALLPLLAGGEAAEAQRRAFARLRTLLGDADPARGVAELAESLAERRREGG